MKNCIKCYPKMCRCKRSTQEKLYGLELYLYEFRNWLTIDEKQQLTIEINELKGR